MPLYLAMSGQKIPAWCPDTAAAFLIIRVLAVAFAVTVTVRRHRP